MAIFRLGMGPKLGPWRWAENPLKAQDLDQQTNYFCLPEHTDCAKVFSYFDHNP